MKKYADLHVHTDFSDGTFSPEKVVRVAAERKLSCIAICDHDCVDGIEPAMAVGATLGVEIIPGVELTVIEKRKEIHMLGYFVDWKAEWFRRVMHKVQGERRTRMQKMLKKLARFNINIPMERVETFSSGKGSMGRLHLAQALLEAKAVPNIQKAFDMYIGDFRPCYVEDVGFKVKEAVKVIKKAGGVSVLAHPFSVRDENMVNYILDSGVQGIEVYHTDHPSLASKKYLKIAEERGLIATGGSDCHGMGKGRILMGSVRIPYEIVKRLRDKASSK